MTPFFSSPESLARLDAEARSWLNTPFAARQAAKGAGVDCVHLLAEIYKVCGLFPSPAGAGEDGRRLGEGGGIAIPCYTLDGGRHTDVSQVIKWLTISPHFWPVPVLVPLAGDTLCFRQKRAAHHVGLLIPSPAGAGEGNIQFIHAAERYGVTINDLADPMWRRALVAVFRPVCPSPAGAGEGGRRPDEGSQGETNS